jgi:X-Pro dipeptidyl-peptidase
MRRIMLAAVAALTLIAVPAASAAPPPEGGTAFEPEPRSKPLYDVEFPSDDTRHMVKAADGADLYVETYLPAQRDGGPKPPAKVPIVVFATPYDTLNQALGNYNALDHLVQRGYGVAIHHVRGTGNSGGCLEQTSTKQIDDTARVIHFLGTEAPYSDGNIGMYGVSYDAETQTSVAGLGDSDLIKPLKAIIPIASVGGQYEYSNFDGVPFAQQALLSNTTYFPISAAPGLADPTAQHPHEKLGCQPELYQASLDESGDMTPFWRSREYRPGAKRVKAATLYVHGLRDFNVLPLTIRGWFDQLPATTPHKGLFGVWEHAEPDGGSVEEDWQRADWLAMATAWYDRYLKGLDTNVEDWPNVQVQDSTGRWRGEDSFPLTGSDAGQLALDAGGKLGATAPAGETTFNEDDEEGPSFTTPALERRLSLTGQPVLDLWLKSSEPDAHLTASIEVLGEDGEPLEQSDGTPVATYGLRSLRHLDPITRGWFHQEHGKDAPTNTPIHVPIRFLPTDLVVPKGGRLRVTIAGTTFDPRESSSSGAGSDITLLHGCGHASALRFLLASAGAPQLNVREPDEAGERLRSDDTTIRRQDGAGLSSAKVCGEAPSRPNSALH